MICTIAAPANTSEWNSCNEYESPVTEIKREIARTLSLLIVSGYTEFYTNCERTVSLWAAELLCLLKERNPIQLHIAIPYEEQCKNWTEEYRDRYFRLHMIADSVHFVSRQYHERCYQETDIFMTNKSDMVVVLGNPDEPPFIAEYAEQIHIPCEIIRITPN